MMQEAVASPELAVFAPKMLAPSPYAARDGLADTATAAACVAATRRSGEAEGGDFGCEVPRRSGVWEVMGLNPSTIQATPPLVLRRRARPPHRPLEWISAEGTPVSLRLPRPQGW
jgi:hypothetical protein